MPMGIPIRVHMRVRLPGLLISSTWKGVGGGLGSASGWVCFSRKGVGRTVVGDAGGLEGLGLGGKVEVVSACIVGFARVGAGVGTSADITRGVGGARCWGKFRCTGGNLVGWGSRFRCSGRNLDGSGSWGGCRCTGGNLVGSGSRGKFRRTGGSLVGYGSWDAGW